MSTKPFEKTLSEVKILLSPSPADYESIRSQYKQLIGTDGPTKNPDNIYENPVLWNKLVDRFKKTLVVENISILEAEAIAEPIRMMHPDQHVNIVGSDFSFIGNVTWTDQLKMFWGYPTYTEAGKAVMAKRSAEQEAIGIFPSRE